MKSPSYPEIPVPSNLNDEIRRLAVTRKGFFNMATYMKWAHIVTGALGYIGISTGTMLGVVYGLSQKFPAANLPVLGARMLTILLYSGIPFVCLHEKANFDQLHREHFRAGVEYNILYRRLVAISTIKQEEARQNAYREYMEIRDEVERNHSMYSPEQVHKIAKGQIEKAMAMKDKDLRNLEMDKKIE